MTYEPLVEMKGKTGNDKNYLGSNVLSAVVEPDIGKNLTTPIELVFKNTMVCISHLTSPHPTLPHLSSPHPTLLLITLPYPTSLLLTLPHPTSLLLTPPHFSSPYLTPPHFSSPYPTPPHFSSSYLTSCYRILYFYFRKSVKTNRIVFFGLNIIGRSRLNIPYF